MTEAAARSGLFVSFEGPEGGGKSTHAAALAARLGRLGVEIVRTREPGGTRTGETIRDILQHDLTGETIHPETETLLFCASRAQLVRSVIAPALGRGACVICDRFADSTTAYQGFGRGFGVETMLAINAFAVGAYWPDITLLLDLDVGVGFERIGERNRAAGKSADRFERETQAFHEEVRRGYHELARRFPKRFCIIDANRAEDAVDADIWTAVEPLVRERGMGNGRTA